jgi:hypothetical protein
MTNTVPAFFWVLFYSISDRGIPAECRKEVLARCSFDEDTCTLDITRVKASCPILLSILKEVISTAVLWNRRLISLSNRGSSTRREVPSEKGRRSLVMIPDMLQHTSTPAYSSTVKEPAQALRTMPRTQTANSSSIPRLQRRHNPLPRPTLRQHRSPCFCTLALSILRFDFEPVKGEWVSPQTDEATRTGTIAPPNNNINIGVRVTPATGALAGKKWNVVLSGSGSAEGVPLSAKTMSRPEMRERNV